MCSLLVAMNTCRRGVFARRRRPSSRLDVGLARAAQRRRSRSRSRTCAISRTDSSSPGDAAGKPASITSTPSSSSFRAMRSFSSSVMVAPGRLLAVAQRRVEDAYVVVGRRHQQFLSSRHAELSARRAGALAELRRCAARARSACGSTPSLTSLYSSASTMRVPAGVDDVGADTDRAPDLVAVARLDQARARPSRCRRCWSARGPCSRPGAPTASCG